MTQDEEDKLVEKFKEFLNNQKSVPEGVGTIVNENFWDLMTDRRNDPCEHCPNYPKNGGSGICHCTLGNKITFIC